MAISLPQVPRNVNGFILYDGPSQLGAGRILAIATGFARKSSNEKTGDMIQVWIIPADAKAHEAYTAGLDVVVCGDCKHRSRASGGNGTCYVNVAQGPSSVWQAWHNGAYLPIADYRVFAGRAVRFGAYGDPCAVPIHIWANILTQTDQWTSYTHQWNKPQFEHYRTFCMASVDNRAEFYEARAQGWRTFRVRTADEKIEPREFICPASEEGGYRKSCIDCRACNGAGNNAERGSVTIIVHGAKGKVSTFNRNAQA